MVSIVKMVLRLILAICFQILGFSLAIIGFLGATITGFLPWWKVTAFIGAKLVTEQTIWKDLWMNCVMQSTGQCKIYDSMLALPLDLQVTRALVVVTVVIAIFGIILGLARRRCTNLLSIAAGALFICAGILILCWSASTVISDFDNPIMADAPRIEIGASLFIGWASAAMLILGGALLCCSFSCKNRLKHKVSAGAKSVTNSLFKKKQK